ncbi:MAG: PH domain-containing protein [Candidatus Sungbacteria bacterium]|uniref:PH domain-containing protein n=1 Tax=Candidatus Sungiibacteriota bacterium TaxID=2750080 RepID=A0A9D6LMT6_9BACT|nr:PH domain-containing protein [Candidatus Sungbacteria bacterium]
MSFLHLDENEAVQMVIRRHWWALLTPSVSALALLILPALVVIFGQNIMGAIDPAMMRFGIAVYFLLLSVFVFTLWVEYYLDVWIITSRRIIDIDQLGLFRRTISEFPLDRIQDVTVEVKGIIPTLLRFGDLKVETAGHLKSFVLLDAPNPEAAKNLLLSNVEKSETVS